MAISIEHSKATVRKQREIEREVLQTEERQQEPARESKAVQAGARPYPEPPFPAQHIHKPGRESEEIAPAFVFLASPQCSSYISGEILSIIGGY